MNADRAQNEPSPDPSALPSPMARALAFTAIVLGGACGAVIGFAFVKVQSDSEFLAGAGLLVGAIGGAIGVAIVAILGLRAMGEWRDIQQARSATTNGGR